MFNLKRKVKNKVHVEVSICEAYIVEKISIFISYYFESQLRLRINHVQRNDDGREVFRVETCQYSLILDDSCQKTIVKGIYFSEIEFRQAHNHMLFNFNEHEPFIQ